MNAEQEHEANVELWKKLEMELIEMIADTGDAALMDKFTEWQQQRNKCNDSYNSWLEARFSKELDKLKKS